MIGTFSKKQLILFTICFMIFIDTICGSLVVPILPELFMNVRYGFLLDNLDLSKDMLYGLSFSLFSLFCLLGMSILGNLADRYGKDKLVLYGLSGIVLTNLLCVLSIATRNVWLFLLTRIIIGFLAGTYSVGMAIISSISTNDNDRIYNFKLSSVSSLAGSLLGPSLSIFNSINYNIVNPLLVPFLFAALLGTINLLVLFFNFKYLNSTLFLDNKSLSHLNFIEKNNLKIPNNYFSKLYIFSIADNMNLFLYISFLFLHLGLGLYCQSLSLFLAKTFLYTPKNIGALMLVLSCVMSISMYLIQPFITRYLPYQIQLKIGLIAIFLIFFVYAICSYFTMSKLVIYEYLTLFIILILHLTIPFITLGFANLFAKNFDGSKQGHAMGKMGQISTCGNIIPGILMGHILSINYGILLTISALLIVLCYLTLNRYKK